MTGRYPAMFARLAQRGEGALGAFVMLGDPEPEASFAAIMALIEGGADMLELGVPFSDPIADGPVIQAAAVRALANGATPSAAFELIARVRAAAPEIPIGILSYANLALARGMNRFYRDAADVGADSILLADVPADECAPFCDAAAEAGIDQVLIAASNTPPERITHIAARSRAFVYCLARAGVTGAGQTLTFDHGDLLDQLRAANAAPAVFGFGVSNADHVRAGLAAGAAGVISGSAVVACAAAHGPGGVRALVAELKRATLPDSAR